MRAAADCASILRQAMPDDTPVDHLGPLLADALELESAGARI